MTVDLTQFDSEYEAAPVNEGNSFDPIPDGKYAVTVERVEIAQSKGSGAPMIKWTLNIDGPKFAGRKLWRHSMLATTRNIQGIK